MKRVKRKRERDPVISLINIVFLILIFFMVAGTLSSPTEPSLRFVQAETPDCCVPPDAIGIDRFGHFLLDGRRTGNVSAILSDRDGATNSIRLLPDRDLPAVTLLKRVRQLKDHGVQDIVIVTEAGDS
ncbi:biopolymer transporter ExbD [Hyphomonas sp.]|jgi:biopolymer transport protein ExbD|uniref:ExbD/TolR family protein n=1 Tax=Hyphomonas sp. TaxID=87 RepID=UPI0025C032A2|nr:biopolymer transporter ExbD [Hyphomonas sp.]